MASTGSAGQVSNTVLDYFGPALQRNKTAVIAYITGKEAVRQPVFLLLLGIGIVCMLLSYFMPYFTFGEDIKMVKDTGLMLIIWCGLFLALWTASTSIAEDIEHRTAITLLSKPINRRQFIVGKFLGINLAVALLFLLLAVVFGAVLYYKVGYDARESARTPPPTSDRWNEVIQVVPGLVLAYFQVVVLSSISVAISTRLPMLVNLVLCVAIFFLGHLTPILVQASASSFELVQFTAQFGELVLPALEFFNVGPAIATGSEIPNIYIGEAFLYCVLYTGVGLLLAFILFEDRDLA